ncbi:lipoprotein [Alcanivorax hongdengensis A-11-3]|uniref:Lipoprotein n=2 Tax=Alcanivorax hongdengensis TaxID=519051 RepID=L0WBE6_9GAMM|nr:lipoprotein [Alcanivorax hongdengensis A-11-3]
MADLGNSYRAERWEGSFRLNGLQSESFDGKNGSSADIDDAVGFGFDFAYNLDENLALGMALEWVDTDFETTSREVGGSQSYSGKGDLEMTTLNVNGTYYFLPKVITPYVHASLGATYLDTDVPTGPPVPVCWWDPWWGYYCGLDTPTLSESAFSYEVGAGVRWEVNDAFFVRGGYSQQWLDVGKGAGTVDVGLYRLGLGFYFQ